LKHIILIFCTLTMVVTSQCLAQERAPLLIAPMVGGTTLFEYLSSREQPETTFFSKFFSKDDDLSFLKKYLRHDIDPKTLLKAYEKGADKAYIIKQLLEPFGKNLPSSPYRLGYTFGVSLLQLYEKQGNRWTLQQDRIDSIFKTILEVEKPMVLYLMLNHFDAGSPLAKELAKDKQNLMFALNGKPPLTEYFNSPVIPYTLEIDEDIPVNQYRFSALRALARSIAVFDKKHPGLIHAVTLGGEIHHLLEDFEGGTGSYENNEITDYSPRSLEGFVTWLHARHGSLKEFNRAMGTSFDQWSQVPVPRKNIRTAKLNNFLEHFDSYAHGIMPVFGWVWFDHLPQDFKLHIYVDGLHVGEPEYHINRLDVYQNKKPIDNPNTGFNYNWDYTRQKPGIHTITISMTALGSEVLLGSSDVVIMKRDQSPPAPKPAISLDMVNMSDFRNEQHLDKNRFDYWVDRPRQLQDLYYNPLAKEWYQYRCHQVERFMQKLFNVAHDQGVSGQKLYSHQIYPQLNGSWNVINFATSDSLSPHSPYMPGINLYGGATYSPRFFHLVKTNFQQKPYGVPEFHPQLHKNPERFKAIIEQHYKHGASFLSPYYIGLQKVTRKSRHQKFSITPSNLSYGSKSFFKAIKELLASEPGHH